MSQPSLRMAMHIITRAVDGGSGGERDMVLMGLVMDVTLALRV
jgi:hypothetical protein